MGVPRTRQVYETAATHTRVRVTFYSHEGDGFSGVVEGSHPEFGKIVSVTTSNQMGAPKGSFNIVVKKPQETRTFSEGLTIRGIGEGESWTRLWDDPEGTWVLLQWVCDGEVIDDMLGMIDTVSESTGRAGMGARNETYTISGSSFGKIFEQTIPYVSMYDDPANVPLGPLLNRLIVGFEGGPPGAYVDALIEAWVGNYENRNLLMWLLPTGMGQLTFYDILQRQIGCRSEPKDGLLQNPHLVDLQTGGGKNLWSLMSEHANVLMNEMFVDLAPPPGANQSQLTNLVPTIFLRRKPYKVRGDSTKWDRLLMHDLTETDIQRRDVAKGGPAARFNYWTIQLAGQQNIDIHSVLHGATGDSTGYPGGYPIWNLASIEKHGFRLWHQSSNYLPIGLENSQGDIARQTANWLRRCHDWHSVAIYELSGTLTTSRVRPEIRIGQRVLEHHIDGEIQYYVEAVTNSWSYGGAGVTKLTVSRGEYEGDDHLELVYRELDRRVGVSTALAQVEDETEFEVFAGDVADDDSGRTVNSEGSARGYTGSRAFQEALQVIDDFVSPSEQDAERAYNGEPEQTGGAPEVESDSQPSQTTESTQFGQEELENGDPIPVSENSVFDDPSDDPLFGLDLDGLGP